MTTINVASLSAPGKTPGLSPENGETVDGMSAIFDAILSAMSEWDLSSGEEGTASPDYAEGEPTDAEQVLAKVISDDSVKPYLDDQTGKDLLPLLESILTQPNPKEAMLKWANQIAPMPLTETIMLKPLSDQNPEHPNKQAKTNDLLFQTMANQQPDKIRTKNGYEQSRHSVQILASLFRKTLPTSEASTIPAPIAPIDDAAVSPAPLEHVSLPHEIYGPHPQQDMIAGMSVRVDQTINSPAPELSVEHLYGPFEQHSPMAKITSSAATMPISKLAPNLAANLPQVPTISSGATSDALKTPSDPTVNPALDLSDDTDPMISMTKKAKSDTSDHNIMMPKRHIAVAKPDTLPDAPSMTKADLMEAKASQLTHPSQPNSGTHSGTAPVSHSVSANAEQGGSFGQQSGQQSGQQQGQNGNPGTNLDTQMGLDQGKDGRLMRLNMNQDNWPDRLIRHVQSGSNGSGDESIEIILEPKRLGRLVLKISMTGNVSSVNITSTSVEAASMLADTENRLQQVFEQHGLRLGQMNTSSWQGAQHGNQGHQGNSSGEEKQNPNQNNSGQKDSADDPSTKTLDNANNGQINILA